MTAMPEAKLAREAELCYALVALPTDYDCWRPHPGNVDQHQLIAEILGNVKVASAHALDLLRRAIPLAAGDDAPCTCHSALALGIWSDRARITPEVRAKLQALIGKYLA
jgi:5'-methylthioadenosine phosphorylase